MAAFQIISDNNKPRFVVLPFGDEAAAQDYLDELWAEKAVAKYNKKKPKKLYSLEEAKQILSSPNLTNTENKRDKRFSQSSQRTQRRD